jgi:hypothetical protein
MLDANERINEKQRRQLSFLRVFVGYRMADYKCNKIKPVRGNWE